MKDSRQRILDKLAKTNKRSTSVKKRNVKLGVVDDIQDSYNELEIKNENWIDQWLDATAIIDDLLEESQIIFEEGEMVQNQLDELVNSLNEVGLEPDKVISDLILGSEMFFIKKNDLYIYINQLKSKIDNI